MASQDESQADMEYVFSDMIAAFIQDVDPDCETASLIAVVNDVHDL